MAEQMGVPFLGRLPIYEPIRVGSDVGIPLVIAEPNSGAAQAFMKVASQMAAQISMKAIRAEAEFKGRIPLVPVQVSSKFKVQEFKVGRDPLLFTRAWPGASSCPSRLALNSTLNSTLELNFELLNS